MRSEPPASAGVAPARRTRTLPSNEESSTSAASSLHLLTPAASTSGLYVVGAYSRRAGFLSEAKESRLETMSTGQRHPCTLPSLRRQECHMNHGIQNEECVREELTEKRCFAELLCRREAARFYREPIRRKEGKGSCSHLVELFAFPENEMVLPDAIQKSDREHCRGVVHELAKCLSKHRVGRATLLDPRSS